jgi:5'-nucleotidase/UDP-sugar diphosphatase
MKRKFFIVAAALTLLTLGTGLSKQETKKLTILHTNDHHGHFWTNEAQEWGMPARATLIETIRSEVGSTGGQVLLLSGGDVNTGTPASDMNQAEPDFLGMNYMKYDAMAVGNHEFDVPLETVIEQQTWAGFPFLAANIFYKGTNERPFKPYIIVKRQGLRVALIGLTTDETPSISLKFPKDRLEMRSPIEVAKKLVPTLRSQADVVIALTHMGHYADGEHGSQPPGDVTLARQVEGIDVIIGGHTQNPLFQPDVQNGTLILQAHEWGRYLGRLDLEIGAHGIIQKSYQLIPINHQGTAQRIPEDQALKKILEPFQTSAEEIMQEPVGSSTGIFDGSRGVIRSGEAPLGNLAIKVLQESTKSDVAVLASGTLRATLPKGPLNFGNVLLVHPFQLTFVTVEFTGQELLDYLAQLAKKEPGDGAFPQFGGLELQVKDGALTSIKINNEPLKLDKTYILGTTDFHAKGGGGYPEILDHSTFKDTKMNDAKALKAYLQTHSPISPEQYPVTGYYQRN